MSAVNKGHVRDVLHRLRSISEVLIAAPKTATVEQIEDQTKSALGYELDLYAAVLHTFLDKSARDRWLRCRKCGMGYQETNGNFDDLPFYKTEGSICGDASSAPYIPCTGRLRAQAGAK